MSEGISHNTEPGASASGGGASGNGTRRCYWCAEFIQQEARVCKHCGHNVEGLTFDGSINAAGPTGSPPTVPAAPTRLWTSSPPRPQRRLRWTASLVCFLIALGAAVVLTFLVASKHSHQFETPLGQQVSVLCLSAWTANADSTTIRENNGEIFDPWESELDGHRYMQPFWFKSERARARALFQKTCADSNDSRMGPWGASLLLVAASGVILFLRRKKLWAPL